MKFAPVAIIGQGCVLPGAFTLDELWEGVETKADFLSEATEADWRLSPSSMAAWSGADQWSTRGGYIRGFDSVFNSTGFLVSPDEILRLDPSVHWLLQAARTAIASAGLSPAELSRGTAGAIVGNLSLPTRMLSKLSESIWLDEWETALQIPGLRELAVGEMPDPRNRFISGFPTHLLAQALGLTAGSYAIDAACASSLYAITLACDWLHQGRADVMLAGALNGADPLFLHTGFRALTASSRTGQSRPFHAQADGLVPSEGAGVIVLKRLEDAVSAGDPIVGVIRGVGLSNDGGKRSFLVPAKDGQVEAMQKAYAMSGLRPADVSFVECHATGTVVGDSTEIASMGEVFDGVDEVPIGSLKSNMGHLITASGLAGLFKVLRAMKEGVRPATRCPDQPIQALAGTPFRLVREAEPWGSTGPRVAAISSFGFGGNNAHLLVEEWLGQAFPQIDGKAEMLNPDGVDATIAIVGMGVQAGSAAGKETFMDWLFRGGTQAPGYTPQADTVMLTKSGLPYPPKDLEVTQAQQLMLLKAGQEALSQVNTTGCGEIGVYTGMQCDAEIPRYIAAIRLTDWVADWASHSAGMAVVAPNYGAGSQRHPSVAVALEAATVVGLLPNIVANRLNHFFRCTGPSFSVSSEELSGLDALGIAMDSLHSGEIDMAMVGAVDLCCEPVQSWAAEQIGVSHVPADAAVVLVVKRLADAKRAGDTVYAVLSNQPVSEASETSHLRFGDEMDGALDLRQMFGHAHAASALLHVAAAALCCHYHAQPQLLHKSASEPWLCFHERGPSAQVVAKSFTGFQSAVWVHADPDLIGSPLQLDSSLNLSVYSGEPDSYRFAAHPAPFRPFSLLKPASEASVLPKPPELPPILTNYPFDPAQSHAPISPVQSELSCPSTASTTNSWHPALLIARTHQQMMMAHLAYQTQQSEVYQQFRHMTALLKERLFEVAAIPSTAHVVDVPLEPVQPHIDIELTPLHRMPTGPAFSRQQLEILASGKISSVFGALFERQDSYARQVRMPEPPLLLADRVTGLAGEPGSLGTGIIWTETDVQQGAWYLHDGRMPFGLMVESGQADLLLISWLGADFLNQGERVYRLLGCEMTFHGELPAPEDTLKYEIHVDGHARHGDVRLFFFHYDCYVNGQKRLTMRHGQAGFFTDEELAQSKGVMWDPADEVVDDQLPCDAPAAICTAASFTKDQVVRFSEGDAFGCFGPGFELAATHTRTPKIAPAMLLFLEEVTKFDVHGGPWGRGYLRAETTLTGDEWYFPCHFKGDPAMPGTLMMDGCLQAMAFFMTALGFTLDKDGYRFEPVSGIPYKAVCRGQVTPSSRRLVYEVFVTEVRGGDEPQLFADVLVTVDGLKAFHARRMGLTLVPDWPISSHSKGSDGYVDPKPVASNGYFKFGYASLLACAWGKPSEAFGEAYAVFDGTRRLPRLPGPPYHFMSRVTDIKGTYGRVVPGTTVEVEYDIPHNAWYLDANGHRTMPYAVLLEAALQPCGWLTAYMGIPLSSPMDVSFRNLDGTGTLYREVLPDRGPLVTKVKVVSVSRMGETVIENFEVECFQAGDLVYRLSTVFGHFSKASLMGQAGLPATREEVEQRQAPSAYHVDLTLMPERFFWRSLRLAKPPLLMVDRLTGWWPTQGKAGLGRMRAEKTVNPYDWFFKAHFFQDPVQPGSLGLEAMIQLLQASMIEMGLHQDLMDPQFEPIQLSQPLAWKYRGQVLPQHGLITIEIEITDIGRDGQGVYCLAEATLWVDGLKIYQSEGLGMRMVERSPVQPNPWVTDEIFHPQEHPWIYAHQPTYNVPVMPFMWLVDRMARAVQEAYPDHVVSMLRDVQMHRWFICEESVRMRIIVEPSPGAPFTCRVLVRMANPDSSVDDSEFQTVVTGWVMASSAYPIPGREADGPVPLSNGQPELEDIYAAGHLFHGPDMQVLQRMTVGRNGSATCLDAGMQTVPVGLLHPLLLDGATHGIVGDELERWAPEVQPGQVCFPSRLLSLQIFGQTPTSGMVRGEVRFQGFYGGDGHLPQFRIHLYQQDALWVVMDLVEVLFTQGPMSKFPAAHRRAFLADGQYVQSARLSTDEGGMTRLSKRDVQSLSWLPGALQKLYAIDTQETHVEAVVAIKEHVAHQLHVHPSMIEVSADHAAAWQQSTPNVRFSVHVEEDDSSVLVRYKEGSQ